MELMELGRELVRRCNAGEEEALWAEHYADDIESVEGSGSEEMPAVQKGMDALKAKSAWWYDNHEVHEARAEGPYVGARPDQFAVRFVIDVTPKGGERMQMDEVALYTVRDGKVVREEFLYSMG